MAGERCGIQPDALGMTIAVDLDTIGSVGTTCGERSPPGRPLSPIYRRCIWVLAFDPVWRAARNGIAIFSLRNDAFRRSLQACWKTSGAISSVLIEPQPRPRASKHAGKPLPCARWDRRRTPGVAYAREPMVFAGRLPPRCRLRAPYSLGLCKIIQQIATVSPAPNLRAPWICSIAERKCGESCSGREGELTVDYGEKDNGPTGRVTPSSRL
jgi:hypothetical protein